MHLKALRTFSADAEEGRKVKEKEKKVKRSALHKHNQECACLCSAHRTAECVHCFECVVFFPHEDSQ